jgi:hypothetical protein
MCSPFLGLSSQNYAENWFYFASGMAVLDEVFGLSTVEATSGRTGKSEETSTRGTRLIGRSGGSSGTNKDRMLEWI